MANMYEPQADSDGYAPRSSGSGKGCLWGCLLAFGLVVFGFICAGVGTYFWVSNQIAKYTSETPVELPTVEYSQEELAALESRVETFQQQVKGGETPEEDLVLTADDINALISKEEQLKGKVYVKIEDNQVKGDVSFPADMLPGGKGRFFNGSATFDVSMEGGVLIVTAESAVVNGEPVPDQFMEAFRQQNLAQDIYKDPENAKFMRQFEDIRIEDNKFVLRVKRDGAAEPSAEETPSEATSEEADPGTGADGETETGGDASTGDAEETTAESAAP